MSVEMFIPVRDTAVAKIPESSSDSTDDDANRRSDFILDKTQFWDTTWVKEKALRQLYYDKYM